MSTKRERAEVTPEPEEKRVKIDDRCNDEVSEFPHYDLIIVTAPKKVEEEEEDIGDDSEEDEEEDEYDEDEDEDDEDEDEDEDISNDEKDDEQAHDKKLNDDNENEKNIGSESTEEEQTVINEDKQHKSEEREDELLGSFVKNQQLQRWSATPLLSYIQTVKKMSLSLYDHTEEGWKEIEMAMNGIKPLPESSTERRDVIGMCVVREDEHGAEITQLYVDGEYRYRGVGGRIVRSVLRLQRQRGVKQCITFAVGSSHFYKKVGFRKRKCKDNEGSERCEMFIDL